LEFGFADLLRFIEGYHSGLCSCLDACHDVTLTVILNVIVLFLPCALSLDVFRTGIFLGGHLAWGGIYFYRVMLCGKNYS
jgi:hypothetical protein